MDTGFNKTAYDTSLYGGTDSTGAISEVFGKDAISNAFMMWATSSGGDVLRNPSRGGILLPFLTKPMGESARTQIITILRAGIQNDFEPSLVLGSLQVVADYERKKWKINLNVYSPQYKVETDIKMELKNLV